MRIRSLFVLGALLGAVPAAAQRGGVDKFEEPEVEQSCRVVPDTAVVPTAGQIRERRELRARLDSIGRANGVAEPAGLLLVDVDSTRQGKVIFIETNYPQPVADAATRAVGEYLRTLQGGRAYQALVRIDGDYAALAPGKRHCAPALANQGELSTMVQRVLARHPEAGTHSTPRAKRAVVRLVVDRAGKVAYVEVDTPTGDPNLDPYLAPIAERLRFLPAKLDDAPFDARFRFTLTFNVR